MKKNKNIKKVYVGFAADILHEGHINILKIDKIMLITLNNIDWKDAMNLLMYIKLN